MNNIDRRIERTNRNGKRFKIALWITGGFGVLCLFLAVLVHIIINKP